MKLFTASCAFFISILTLYACPICDEFAYTSLQNNNNIQLNYRHRVFNGYEQLGHQSVFRPQKNRSAKLSHIPIGTTDLYIPSQQDYELFRSIELKFNYKLRDKYLLSVLLPYHINDDYFAQIVPEIGPIKDSLNKVQGIGDLVLGISRFKKIKKDNYTHVYSLGLNVSLPTGRFQLANSKGQAYDPSQQPGSGVYELIFGGQYIFLHQSMIGLSASASYQRSTQRTRGSLSSGNIPGGVASLDYRFGDRFSSAASVFYNYISGEWRIVPKAGLLLEHARKDLLNSDELENTGGTALLGTLGVDVTYYSFTLKLAYQYSLKDYYDEEQLNNAGRINTTLQYNF